MNNNSKSVGNGISSINPTYKEILNELNELDKKQLETSITFYIKDQDEYYPAQLVNGKVLSTSEDDDVLGIKDHIIITI